MKLKHKRLLMKIWAIATNKLTWLAVTTLMTLFGLVAPETATTLRNDVFPALISISQAVE